jgi:hypothetical protein
MCLPLYATWCFSCNFQCSFLVLCAWCFSYNIMWRSSILDLLFGVLKTSWNWVPISFKRFGNFSAIILFKVFYAFILYLLSFFYAHDL